MPKDRKTPIQQLVATYCSVHGGEVETLAEMEPGEREEYVIEKCRELLNERKSVREQTQYAVISDAPFSHPQVYGPAARVDAEHMASKLRTVSDRGVRVSTVQLRNIY